MEREKERWRERNSPEGKMEREREMERETERESGGMPWLHLLVMNPGFAGRSVRFKMTA